MDANKKLTGKMETRLASIGRRIDRLIESAQSALDESGEPLQKELKRVEEHLSATRAQIRQDVARTRDDFSTAVEDELGIWKGRLEELNLQRALGTMEVRERITPVLEQASIKLDQARRALRDLSEDEFEEGLTKSVKESLVELRSEIATAEELS
jgi:hypothetical protein